MRSVNVKPQGGCVASFPGLPRFFLSSCSSVCVDSYIRVLLSTQTEEQRERGRAGNEARGCAHAIIIMSSWLQALIGPKLTKGA